MRAEALAFIMMNKLKPVVNKVIQSMIIIRITIMMMMMMMMDIPKNDIRYIV